MLIPTNPSDRAVERDTDVVNEFRNRAALKELSRGRTTPTGPSFRVAEPIQIANAACLQRRSVQAAAPPTMFKRRGSSNGFGCKHNEIIGAQVISVPPELPIENAKRAFCAFMISLAPVFAAVVVSLNLTCPGSSCGRSRACPPPRTCGAPATSRAPSY